MNTSSTFYLAIPAFLLSLVAVIYMVPKVNIIGKKFSLIDYLDKRKVDRKPLVRLGGFSIIFGFMVSMLITNFFFDLGIESLWLKGLTSSIYLGAILIYILGVSDDLFNLPAFPKLIMQILIASYAWQSGVQIESLEIIPQSFGIESLLLPNSINYLLTIFWIVAIINAINWLDGLDGLAAGISLITALGIILISLDSGYTYYFVVANSLLGSCLGFLFFNFKPAKILMGDGGSYFLGFMLSIMSILISKTDSSMYSGANNIYIPILLLFIAIVDMAIVITIRIKNGNLPFYPDKNHIHHRLLDKGMRDIDVVNYIYRLSFWFATLSLLFTSLKIKYILIIASTFLLIIKSKRTIRIN